MRASSLQGLGALGLVAWGCFLVAGLGAALLAAGLLLFIDYAADRWRMP